MRTYQAPTAVVMASNVDSIRDTRIVMDVMVSGDQRRFKTPRLDAYRPSDTSTSTCLAATRSPCLTPFPGVNCDRCEPQARLDFTSAPTLKSVYCSIAPQTPTLVPNNVRGYTQKFDCAQRQPDGRATCRENLNAWCCYIPFEGELHVRL
jgi:hypothetical protein